MKKSLFLLGTTLLVSSCLVSCGEKDVTYEEAKEIVGKYDPEAGIKDIKTIRTEIVMNGDSAEYNTNMVSEADINDGQYYVYTIVTIGTSSTETLSNKDADGNYYTKTTISSGSLTTKSTEAEVKKSAETIFSEYLKVCTSSISSFPSKDEYNESEGDHFISYSDGSLKLETGDGDEKGYVNFNKDGLVTEVETPAMTFRAILNARLNKKSK